MEGDVIGESSVVGVVFLEKFEVGKELRLDEFGGAGEVAEESYEVVVDAALLGGDQRSHYL